MTTPKETVPRFIAKRSGHVRRRPPRDWFAGPKRIILAVLAYFAPQWLIIAWNENGNWSDQLISILVYQYLGGMLFAEAFIAPDPLIGLATAFLVELSALALIVGFVVGRRPLVWLFLLVLLGAVQGYCLWFALVLISIPFG
ncbi:MAG: hypothetical protein QM775_34780 [Pirellulales bacterium]